MPNGRYSGQKLMRLVSTKTPAKTNRIIPKTPVITFVKYNTATTIASTIRTSLSMEPMFFFIMQIFFSNIQQYLHKLSIKQ